MNKYLEPDDRWPIFGVNSKEEYLSKYVIKGHFHDTVPAEIKDAFVTVEYLLAHAWHYYPLYDEGMNKALRIMEMAVRIKANAMGIITKTKKGQPRPLDNLIQEISGGDHFTELREQLNLLRELRNLHMHPFQHGFMGSMGRQPANIKLLINLINRMFKDEEWHIQVHQQTKEIESLLKTWDGHPLITASGQPLLRRIIYYQVYGPWLRLVAEPILLNPGESITNHQVVAPLQFRLQNFEMPDSGICGKDENGATICLGYSAVPSNMLTYHANQNAIAALPEDDVRMFDTVLNGDAPWFVVEGEYRYWAKESEQIVN